MKFNVENDKFGGSDGEFGVDVELVVGDSKFGEGATDEKNEDNYFCRFLLIMIRAGETHRVLFSNASISLKSSKIYLVLDGKPCLIL